MQITQFFDEIAVYFDDFYVMIRIKLILPTYLFCIGFAFTQGSIAPKYSNEFLNIGVGSDALGSGNAMVARSSSTFSSYWNPAGLTACSSWLEVGAMHSEYFAGITKFDNISLAHKIDDKSTAGLSLIRFAVDDIPNTTQLIDNNGNIDYSKITSFSAADYAALFSYGRKLKHPGLSVGGSFKIIHRTVGDLAKSWGFGLDAGAQYVVNKWAFGLVCRDVTSTFNAWVFTLDEQTKQVFLSTGNTLPQNGVELTLPRLIAASYKQFDIGNKGLYVGSELDLEFTTDGKRNTLVASNFGSLDPRLGIAIGYNTLAVVRAGLMNVQRIKNFDNTSSISVQPSLGLGLNYKAFSLDYALTSMGNGNNTLFTHVFSVRAKLDKPKNSIK